ncbi:MAG: 8-amino-7-oxononanoate synthase [Acidobacteriota bacterium]
MPEINRLEQKIRAHMADLERDGLRRTLRPPTGIDLSSNDYLGLASHPAVKQRMVEAVQEFGCGSTGSRLLRGDRPCFTAVEAKFARFKGAQRALYFSSGYLANLAVLTTFPESSDTVFSDELNHASLIDGVRLSRATRQIYPHLVPPASARDHFLVTESLFSMDGDIAPLHDLAATGAILIVDEAHAVGIYGAAGSGLLEEAGVTAFLSINPCGKALGVAGAFVAGPEWAIEYMIQRARPFIFSTAPPPAVAAALDASLDIIVAEPQRRARLRTLARYLRAKLGLPGDSPIIPIIAGDNDRSVALAAELQSEGFDVRAIRPPTVPVGTARLRISVNVNLTEEILDRFVTCLEKARCTAFS